MRLKIILSYVLLAGLLLGFVAWRLQTVPPAVPLVAILVDHSQSVQNPCAALAGAAALAVQSPPVELSVFLTGDARSAYAPVLIPSRPVPQGRRLIKGRGRLLADREAVVRDLGEQCGKQSTPLTSPIFLGIQNVVAHLRSASGVGDRRLVVITDLRENYDPRIAAALVQHLGAKAKLPIIDNAGVAVSVCGYAQTVEKQGHGRRPPQTDRLLEVWQQLFTDPTLVSFKPFCAPPVASREAQ